MVFAEFQVDSTGWNGTDFSGPKKPVPMCGSDGVYILDGRKTKANQIAEARQRAGKMGPPLQSKPVGFILFQGPKFTNARAITGFIRV